MIIILQKKVFYTLYKAKKLLILSETKKHKKIVRYFNVRCLLYRYQL